VTPLKRVAGAALALIFFCGFLGLGTWQIERRSWKLALIARVDQRVHAPAAPAPGPALWPSVTAQTQEYRHVSVTGTLLNEAATRVQALTVLGSGYWIMTPLRTPDGPIIFVNRGFVPADAAADVDKTSAAGGNKPQDAPVTITGLLRLSEPGGGFLRRNDPSANRWYSRDVAALAKARGLKFVAPYFIDADRASSPGPVGHSPVGGLTVIAFYNNHLVYAITWYTLALMIPVALWLARRDER